MSPDSPTPPRQPSFPLVIALLALLGPAIRPAVGDAAVSPGQTCAASKLAAVAKALVCQSTEQNKLILGRPADVSKCGGKLEKDFSKAEGKANGQCPTGDAASALAVVTDVESAVLAALMASAATTAQAKTCGVRR